MSESDSFIQEVTEEVRKDRMFHLWKRYGPFVIGAIVLIVGAAAVWNWMKHREVLEARETGAAFIAAELSDVEAQAALAAAIEDETAILAQLRLAAAMTEVGDRPAAIEAYRTAARMQAPEAYRQFAVLSAVALDAATGDPALLVNELAPLVQEGEPYRAMALELRGAIRLTAGEIEAARSDLQQAMAAPIATAETRQRVDELLAALGPAPE